MGSTETTCQIVLFLAAVTFLPGRCLATIGEHTATDRWEGLVKYALKIVSGAMICIPRFIKIGSGIQTC
jgi:hypothetical protein